jgi:hypothetical protein
MTVDADERLMLRESLAHTVETTPPAALRAALHDFGWHDLLIEEPEVAVASLATLQGEHLTRSTMLDDVVLSAAGLSGLAGVVFPDLPESEPTSLLSGGTLAVSGVVTSGEPGQHLVPACQDGRIVVVTADLTDHVPGASGLDPDAGWRLRRTTVEIQSQDVLSGVAALEQWQTVRSAGQRALAHELTAIGGRMLAIALEHVSTREQFGRPLASFQAVKHALADVSVWLDCAELGAQAAWEDRSPESAQLAKILAGRLIRVASANCQQVLGGMGFTWEHPFHLYLRRALLLEPLLGSAAQLRVSLGSQLRTMGVPQLAHL